MLERPALKSAGQFEVVVGAVSGFLRRPFGESKWVGADEWDGNRQASPMVGGRWRSPQLE